jgi:hypothetical protein
VATLAIPLSFPAALRKVFYCPDFCFQNNIKKMFMNLIRYLIRAYHKFPIGQRLWQNINKGFQILRQSNRIDYDSTILIFEWVEYAIVIVFYKIPVWDGTIGSIDFTRFNSNKVGRIDISTWWCGYSKWSLCWRKKHRKNKLLNAKKINSVGQKKIVKLKMLVTFPLGRERTIVGCEAFSMCSYFS